MFDGIFFFPPVLLFLQPHMIFFLSPYWTIWRLKLVKFSTGCSINQLIGRWSEQQSRRREKGKKNHLWSCCEEMSGYERINTSGELCADEGQTALQFALIFHIHPMMNFSPRRLIYGRKWATRRNQTNKCVCIQFAHKKMHNETKKFA